jgi:hypothetical protein
VAFEHYTKRERRKLLIIENRVLTLESSTSSEVTSVCGRVQLYHNMWSGPIGPQVRGRVLLDHKCVVGSYWITSVWSGPTGSQGCGRVLLDHKCVVGSYWITRVWSGPTGSQVCG